MATSSQPKTTQRILDALREGPLSGTDLVQYSKAGDTAADSITRLLRQGRITRDDDHNLYSLVTKTTTKKATKSSSADPAALPTPDTEDSGTAEVHGPAYEAALAKQQAEYQVVEKDDDDTTDAETPTAEITETDDELPDAEGQETRKATGSEETETEPIPPATDDTPAIQAAVNDANAHAAASSTPESPKPAKTRVFGAPCKKCNGTEKYKDGSCAPCARGRAGIFHEKERQRKAGQS